MVKASTSGLMVVSTTDNGLITRWRAKALSPGATVVDTKATTRMIKSMGTEPSSGPTAGNTSVSGAKANSTEKEFTSKRARRDKESGRWGRGLSGSKILPISDKCARYDNKDFSLLCIIYFKILVLSNF